MTFQNDAHWHISYIFGDVSFFYKDAFVSERDERTEDKDEGIKIAKQVWG